MYNYKLFMMLGFPRFKEFMKALKIKHKLATPYACMGASNCICAYTVKCSSMTRNMLILLLSR